VPTPKLGLVLTGVEPAAETRYGGYFAVDDAPEDEAAVAATARRFARFGRSR
jgi:hypothetical protein